jgi:hypothetical protein
MAEHVTGQLQCSYEVVVELRAQDELPRNKYARYMISYLMQMYRVIKKPLYTWWYLPHYLAQSDCLAADRQGQEDTRLTLTPSVVPNSNYIIMESNWKCLKYMCVYFCTVIIRCTRHFDHPVYDCVSIRGIRWNKFLAVGDKEIITKLKQLKYDGW